VRLINVGGGASRDVPSFYKGWEQDVLDIDPNVGADIVCDAKKMRTLKSSVYDAVFCSHNLEHFYRHEVPTVLAGFMHVLKPDGFAQIAVPDLTTLFEQVRNRDVDETWYEAQSGKVTFHDVLYGWGRVMANGNLYYAHKCGFTEKSMAKELQAVGFKKTFTAVDAVGNLHAYAFKKPPTKVTLQRLGV
jgi:predicted SAM-dependent methyltransferase